MDSFAFWDVFWGVWDSAKLIVNANCEGDLNKAASTLSKGLANAGVNAATGYAGPRIAKLLKSIFKAPVAGGGNPHGSIEPGAPSVPRDGTRKAIDPLGINGIGGVACGPTSCAMILGDRGIPVNIEQLVRQAGIGPTGTYPEPLARVLRAHGIGSAKAYHSLTVEHVVAATRKGHLMIAQMKLSGSHHYVVVGGVTRRPGLSSELLVAIRDPGKEQSTSPPKPNS